MIPRDIHPPRNPRRLLFVSLRGGPAPTHFMTPPMEEEDGDILGTLKSAPTGYLLKSASLLKIIKRPENSTPACIPSPARHG